MENFTSLINNISRKSGTNDVFESETDDVTDMYNVSPGFPQIVFDVSFAVLIVTGIFGLVANFSIAVLFFISPHVSFFQTLFFFFF